VEAPCQGVRVAGHERCWRHLSGAGLKAALASLSPGADLDARGTVLDAKRLGLILYAVADLHTGCPVFGHATFTCAQFEAGASFENATFSAAAIFEHATFRGGVTFRSATFAGNSRFSHAAFARAAQFVAAVFSKDVMFTGAKFSSAAYFRNATFNGGAIFRAAGFGDTADFGDVTFARYADFQQAEFGQFVTFERVQFRGVASFGGAEFTGDAVFQQAQFYGGPPAGGEVRGGFGGTKFRRDARFDEAVFHRVANLAGAEFGGDALYVATQFREEARFTRATVAGALQIGPSEVGGTLNLSGLRASGAVRVIVAARQVGCSGGEFGGRVWLSLWGGELRLVDSVFAAPVTVESSLEPVGPATGEQAGRLLGRCVPVAVRSLRGTDAGHLTLTDVDLSRCVLSGLRRPELLRLDGRCLFAPAPRGWHLRWRWVPWRWTARETLYEEHLWRQTLAGSGRGAGWGMPDADGGEPGAVIGPVRLAVLYRQLRRAVEDARNEPGAADLYYGEMEMRRLGAVRRGERWLLGAYWLVSGYGLRAGRALAVLAALVAAAAVTQQRVGFGGPVPGLWRCALYAAGSVVSLDLHGHLPALTGWGELVRLLLRVAGPVLLGLAALAVRGRVKR
jgi:pentapeptide repeat protein